MSCIHGLNEINCPTCRIVKHSIPHESLSLKNNSNLNPINPIFNRFLKRKEDLYGEIMPKRAKLNSFSINLVPKPNLLNGIPKFKNAMFLERMKEIDISKADLFNISKKIALESPEWKFEDKE